MKGIIKSMKKAIRDMDKGLLIITIALFIFGLFNIVTASSRESVVNNGTSLYHYFFKQLEMLVAGGLAGCIIVNVSTKKYKPFAKIGFIAFSFILIYLLLKGSSNRGAKNWISLPVIGTIQPSEFMKPIIIVSLSLLFEQYVKKLQDKTIKHYDIIGIILFVGLLAPLIIFLQKDLGTMMIIVGIFGVLFLASPILKEEKFKTIVALIIIGIFGILVMKVTKGYVLSDEQLDRFNFFNPCSTYETGGYQTCNGFIAINSGGLIGLGIGKSKQKYSYIPEPHTDSVFAIIAEENGLLRSSLIFLAYIFILYRILMISSKASTLSGKYMCLGVATYIFAHIFINLGGLFGLIPLTGVPLPFLSYGGSFTISLIVSLALVQRVAIETKRQKITV